MPKQSVRGQPPFVRAEAIYPNPTTWGTTIRTVGVRPAPGLWFRRLVYPHGQGLGVDNAVGLSSLEPSEHVGVFRVD